MGQNSQPLCSKLLLVWLPVSHHTGRLLFKKSPTSGLLLLTNLESNQDFQNQNLT